MDRWNDCRMARCGCRGEAIRRMAGVGKAFFSEEKKQKTFVLFAADRFVAITNVSYSG